MCNMLTRKRRRFEKKELYSIVFLSIREKTDDERTVVKISTLRYFLLSFRIIIAYSRARSRYWQPRAREGERT